MKSFEDLIAGDTPVVVDFYAVWCGPCKMMEPVLSEIKKAMGDKVTVLKIDIDKYPAYAQRYNISSIPATIIFHKNDMVKRYVGVTPAFEILKEIESLLTASTTAS